LPQRRKTARRRGPPRSGATEPGRRNDTTRPCPPADAGPSLCWRMEDLSPD
jgi:hypothetical protein